MDFLMFRSPMPLVALVRVILFQAVLTQLSSIKILNCNDWLLLVYPSVSLVEPPIFGVVRIIWAQGRELITVNLCELQWE